MVFLVELLYVRRVPLKRKWNCVDSEGTVKGVGATVPTNHPFDPRNFTNATLSSRNNFTAVVTLDRVSAASLLQLYIYVGKMSAADFRSFSSDKRMTTKDAPSMIFDGFVNVTLYRGGDSDAVLKAVKKGNFEMFSPVWIFNFRLSLVTGYHIACIYRIVSCRVVSCRMISYHIKKSSLRRRKCAKDIKSA